MSDFDLSACLRRIRRRADMSQRQLAEAAEISTPGMSPDGARDAAGRRLPAHLDATHTGDGPDWEYRRDRPQPWFTFALDRASRDRARKRHGTPDDHQLLLPGDSPQERRAARQLAARRRQEEERRTRVQNGNRPPEQEWECTCPAECDALDDRSGRPVHIEGCPCSCDVG